MDSINEQFHQIYNGNYGLPPYEAKKTPFSPQELLEFSRKQHEWLSSFPPTKEIVIFLVREINSNILSRYEQVAESLTQPVFLITDKWWPRNQEEGSKLKIVFMFENFCYDKGFFYVNTDVMPDKLVITWDRCLFFLSQYPTIFENAWILEDDVAIRGKQTLPRFFAKYANSSADLLAAPPQISEKDPYEWPLWKVMPPSGLSVLWASYNPVTRLSRRFIEVLAQNFVAEKRRLFFLEIFFMSLCISANLKTEYFHDLEKHFRYTPAITFEETQVPTIEFPIFHPVKDADLWNKIWLS